MRNGQRLVKITTDAVILGLLITVLAFPWTGHRTHAWAAYGWAVVVLLHGIWNRKWYAALWRGAYDWRRMIGTLLAVLLWLAALGAVLSGVCLAHFRQELGHALWWRQLHIGCAYWLLVLCGLHFGLHIETLAAPLRQKMCFIKIRKVLPWLGAVLAAAGLWAGWRLAVEPALLFGSSFVPNGGSWYCFAAQAVAVFWLCAFAAYVFTRRKICK